VPDNEKKPTRVPPFAYQWASLSEQPLTVAHFARDRHDHEDAARRLAEAVAGLHDEFPDVHAQLRVLHGSPSTQLLRMADRKCLLVIGQHHELGVYETRLG